MSVAASFYKKAVADFGLAQVSFRVAVLEPYLNGRGGSVARTDTVGRIKAAAWTLDFGIAPDEQTIHVPIAALMQRLPESERAHWLAHAEDKDFSQNFLKMQSAPHSCLDDGTFRAWGEEPLF